MAGFFDDLALPFGVAASNGNGPVLIDRRFYPTTGTDTFPKLASRAVFYGVGGGGWCHGQSYDGGGAAWAKRTVPCAPGGTFNAQIGAGGQAGSYGPTDRSNDGQHTFVTVAGVVVLKAAGGNSGVRYILQGEDYVETPDGRPGNAADCIGDVRISAVGRMVANGTLGDRLFIPGPQSNGGSNQYAMAGFPGCGGQSINATNFYCTGAPGLIIAEFWSA